VSILGDQELGVSSVPGAGPLLLLEKETEGQSCTGCTSEPRTYPFLLGVEHLSYVLLVVLLRRVGKSSVLTDTIKAA